MFKNFKLANHRVLGQDDWSKSLIAEMEADNNNDTDSDGKHKSREMKEAVKKAVRNQIDKARENAKISCDVIFLLESEERGRDSRSKHPKNRIVYFMSGTFLFSDDILPRFRTSIISNRKRLVNEFDPDFNPGKPVQFGTNDFNHHYSIFAVSPVHRWPLIAIGSLIHGNPQLKIPGQKANHRGFIDFVETCIFLRLKSDSFIRQKVVAELAEELKVDYIRAVEERSDNPHGKLDVDSGLMVVYETVLEENFRKSVKMRDWKVNSRHVSDIEYQYFMFPGQKNLRLKHKVSRDSFGEFGRKRQCEEQHILSDLNENHGLLDHRNSKSVKLSKYSKLPDHFVNNGDIIEIRDDTPRMKLNSDPNTVFPNFNNIPTPDLGRNFQQPVIAFNNLPPTADPRFLAPHQSSPQISQPIFQSISNPQPSCSFTDFSNPVSNHWNETAQNKTSSMSFSDFSSAPEQPKVKGPKLVDYSNKTNENENYDFSKYNSYLNS